MKNPFPGMNPYLEERWQAVHARLVTYIADQLQERLPPGLVAQPEEQVAIAEGGQRGSLRPDVKVTEPYVLREPVAAFAGARELPPAPAKPFVVFVEPEQERCVEILDADGKVITVIEVLSPTHKSEEGQADYRRRRRAYITSGVNLVEIDLLRAGEWVLSLPLRELPDSALAPYKVCVFRTAMTGQREYYPLPLRQRLPAVRIPRRSSDRDVVLELQPLLDQVFERGRYWMLDYGRPPRPPLLPEDEKWADELLRASGLRPAASCEPL